MKYILDTNICIYIIKRRPPEVFKRFTTIAPGDVALSVITACELSYGAEKSTDPERNRAALEQFLLPFSILELRGQVAQTYGRVRASLKHSPIGELDLLIASQALQCNATLVTNNEREFRRITGLKLANWVKD